MHVFYFSATKTKLDERHTDASLLGSSLVHFFSSCGTFAEWPSIPSLYHADCNTFHFRTAFVVTHNRGLIWTGVCWRGAPYSFLRAATYFSSSDFDPQQKREKHKTGGREKAEKEKECQRNKAGMEKNRKEWDKVTGSVWCLIKKAWVRNKTTQPWYSAREYKSVLPVAYWAKRWALAPTN